MAGMRRLSPADEGVDLYRAYGRLDPHPTGRASVRLNMISSLDGAASLHGRSGALSGPDDQQLLDVLRTLADVILVGAGTFRTERYGPIGLAPEARARRTSWGLPEVPPVAVITRSGTLDWGSSFFTESEQRPIVITTRKAEAAVRAQAADVADVLAAGEEDVDLAAALHGLGARGVANVILEGGPTINGQIASAGLLDELCLTISPLVVAAAAPTIFGAIGLDVPLRLELADLVESGDYLFCRYRPARAGR